MIKPVLSIIESDRPEKWQEILADLISEPKELVEFLGLDPEARPSSLAACTDFPMKVPKPFAARMMRGNWNDPLLKQVWPDIAEELKDDSLVADPLQEAQFNRQPGLLHKYQGRVLLTAAPHCAIHCRYCFRRHFDYQSNTPGRAQWRSSLDYIAADNSIAEVILSGGDPLAAPNGYLGWLLGELDSIPHVQTIRIHTRLPVVIPQRIDAGLLSLLGNLGSRCVIVMHCNHPNEIDHAVTKSIEALGEDGHILLNQAVLLKGINDEVNVLSELSHALFACGVLPYYLHLPDQVAGTGHFLVSEHEAVALIDSLQAELPGYLVPKLVKEEPGQASKTRLV